jgi:MFS family permease
MLIDVGLYWIAHLGHWSSEEMKIKYKVSSPIDTTGLALYVLSLTFGPNILACLSGYFGRSPLYIISYGIFLLFVLAAALVHSFQCFYVLRYFSGLFSSVATGEFSLSTKYTSIAADDFSVANFGGIVADLWDPHETEPGTSVFLWGSACKSPVFKLFLFLLTF